MQERYTVILLCQVIATYTLQLYYVYDILSCNAYTRSKLRFNIIVTYCIRIIYGNTRNTYRAHRETTVTPIKRTMYKTLHMTGVFQTVRYVRVVFAYRVLLFVIVVGNNVIPYILGKIHRHTTSRRTLKVNKRIYVICYTASVL